MRRFWTCSSVTVEGWWDEALETDRLSLPPATVSDLASCAASERRLADDALWGRASLSAPSR